MDIVDGKGECELCHGYFTITSAGELRKHKCIGDDGIENVPADGTARTPAKRASKKGKPPANVTKLTVGVVQSGVEYLASAAMARGVPCDRVALPEEAYTLGDDASAMIAPFVAFVWPQLPAGAKKLISSLADQEDLIYAMVAWAQYMKRINTITRELHNAQAERTTSNVFPQEYAAPQFNGPRFEPAEESDPINQAAAAL